MLILYLENTIVHYNLSKQKEYKTFCLSILNNFTETMQFKQFLG